MTHHIRAHRLAWVAVLSGWVVAQALFAPSAFRIDEPNLIAIARQISRQPLDPYGFSINWTGTTERAFDVLANPPLLPAWLSTWAALFGWSETSLRLAVLPFSIAALALFVSLARLYQREDRAGIAVLLLCSPAFFLGSLVVMPDVTMLAFLTAAVVASLQVARTNSTAWAIAGTICGFAAPLVKYNGALVFPLALYLLFTVRPFRPRLLVITLSPLAALLLWSWWTSQQYGRSHILAMAEFEAAAGFSPWTGALTALSLGIVPLALTLSPDFAPTIRGAGAAVALIGGVGAFTLAMAALRYPLLPSILFALGIAIAIGILWRVVMASATAARDRDYLLGLLVLWLALGLLFQLRLLFSSVRYMLPVTPAAILLLLGQRRIPRVVLMANVVFCLALAMGDVRIGNLYRAFVQSAADAGKTYYAGHWGLQFYAEEAGGRSVEAGDTVLLEPGDLFLEARNAFPPRARVTGAGESVRQTIEPELWWPVRTIDCDAAANFYGNVIGGCRHFPAYLPFGFGQGPVESFQVVRGQVLTLALSPASVEDLHNRQKKGKR